MSLCQSLRQDRRKPTSKDESVASASSGTTLLCTRSIVCAQLIRFYVCVPGLFWMVVTLFICQKMHLSMIQHMIGSWDARLKKKSCHPFLPFGHKKSSSHFSGKRLAIIHHLAVGFAHACARTMDLRARVAPEFQARRSRFSDF